MVCLSGGMLVEGGKVNHPPGTSISFRADNHAMAPCARVIDRNLLEYSQVSVTVKSPLDILLPVEGDLAGGVDSHRDRIIIDKYA